MIRQDMFDLCWGNVLASSDDGVIRTSLHEEVTIIIEVSGVPRRIPALTDDRRVLTEVLARHLLATNEDFTYRSRRHDTAIRASDFDLNPWDHFPHRSKEFAGLRISIFQGPAVVFRTEDGNCRGRFREAIRVDECHVGKQFEGPFQYARGHFRSAVDQSAQRRWTSLTVLGQGVDNPSEHLADQYGLSDPLPPCDEQPSLGME